MPARPPAVGRVRKLRFAVITGVGLLLATILGGGIAAGELPMNVAISGQPFTATIARADARSITLFPRSIGTAAGSRSSIAILMQSVTLTDLCMSTVAHVPVVGDVTMFLRVPGTGTTADRIVADVSDLGGSIGVRDIHLGVDVSAVGEVKGVATAGIVAGGSVMTTARLTGLSFTAEQLSMRRFDLDVRRGSHSC